MNSRSFVLGFSFLLGLMLSPAALAQPATITYRGELLVSGTPASGLYDFKFAVFDAPTGGQAVGAELIRNAVPCSNGVFSVVLDFGLEWPGVAWLEISTRTVGNGTFSQLTPRQMISSTPYAITAARISGPVAAAQLTGVVGGAQLPGSVLTNGAVGATLQGSFSGNGAGLTNQVVHDHGGLASTENNRFAFINVMDYLPPNPTPAQTGVAIQTALDLTTNCFDQNYTAGWTSNSHSVVYLPNGKYYINQPLFIRTSGTIVRGESKMRTRLVQQANTNVWMARPWGWSEGGANALYNVMFENFGLEMTSLPPTGRRNAGFFLSHPDYVPGSYLWRRVAIRNCQVSGFYVGLRGEYGVGLLVENSEIRQNCNGVWLGKFDNVTFNRCTVGEGYGGAAFGTNVSYGWKWEALEDGQAPAFNLAIHSCEAGGDTTILEAAGVTNTGCIGVYDMNAELNNGQGPAPSLIGPAFNFGAGLRSAIFVNLRVGSVDGVTNQVFRFAGGAGQRASIIGGDIAALGSTISLDTAGDFVNVIGQPLVKLTVTNSAEGRSYTLPAGPGLVRADTSVFPTNSVPPGSATATNVLELVYQGVPRTVATNRAAGGWMRYDHGAQRWVNFIP